ncbi:hypothetical protein BN3087_230006 [Sulfurovum sp. enrichment culture clone C5]|uniref:Uncharacterized protein n=1 Tax=Sulfurovum sp. enrichment culture clone C5 TaxID=497650 RepID=A0A0S4XMT4_9BACT|nr:hypothetical protein BN3087_230006 [Sulfurovum sp. enrichment culture clone C5]
MVLIILFSRFMYEKYINEDSKMAMLKPFSISSVVKYLKIFLNKRITP